MVQVPLEQALSDGGEEKAAEPVSKLITSTARRHFLINIYTLPSTCAFCSLFLFSNVLVCVSITKIQKMFDIYLFFFLNFELISILCFVTSLVKELF